MLYYIRKLWRYRLMRWVVYFWLAITALELILRVILPLLPEPGAANEAFQFDFPGTNPFRDLPDDPVILNAIKETMFISDTIGQLLPTSLAGDDYAYYSTLLRNLETRTDLTPLVLGESKVKQTIDRLGARRDSIGYPMADEPLDLQARFFALSRHWTDLEHNFPRQWEIEYDTRPIPPLMQAHGLVDDGTSQKILRTGGVKLELTPKQQEAADRAYSYYFKRRSWKVSYLKLHPPKPLGAVPRANMIEHNKIHNIWDNLKLSGKGDNVEWIPLYGSLDLEVTIPYTWRDPANEEGILGGVTEEEQDAWWAEAQVGMAERDERGAKIKAWRDEVRPVRQAEENAKWELRKEREEAAKLEL